MDLACPYDGGDLARPAGDRLSCRQGHDFPIVHGIPVLLRADVSPTHQLWRTTPANVSRLSAQPLERLEDNIVDSFVERSLVATSGNLYRRITLPLPRYPIPRFPLPDGRDRTLVDVGSNWGRWALAAARAGYRCVAVDPSLHAALAGTRVARQLRLPVSYVVADARHLPFPRDSFDVCFSYSVLQHLDKSVVEEVLREVGRVTRPQATIAIQMANGLGLRRIADGRSRACARRSRPSRVAAAHRTIFACGSGRRRSCLPRSNACSGQRGCRRTDSCRSMPRPAMSICCRASARAWCGCRSCLRPGACRAGRGARRRQRARRSHERETRGDNRRLARNVRTGWRAPGAWRAWQ